MRSSTSKFPPPPERPNRRHLPGPEWWPSTSSVNDCLLSAPRLALCPCSFCRCRWIHTKSVYFSGIQNIHGVDDHGRVGCIFAACITVLLYGGNSVLEQYALPASQLRFGPVAINPFKGRDAKFGNLLHHSFNIGIRYIVSVDEDGKVHFAVFFHAELFRININY